MFVNAGLAIGLLCITAGAWTLFGFGAAAVAFGAMVWVTSILTAAIAFSRRGD